MIKPIITPNDTSSIAAIKLSAKKIPIHDISVISMQQESAVFALHAGKTGADLHSFYSFQLILIKNAPIPPQMQDIFREMGATFSLLYPE